MNHLVIFLVSFHCILLELFLTRILNLKAWNHVVYVVIPFAMLGYGIGANIQLILAKKISSWSERNVLSQLLAYLGFSTLLTTGVIIAMPLKVNYLLNVFRDAQSVFRLLLAYTFVMIPFVLIGFLVVYLFSQHKKESHRLYFFDLLGAGLGAMCFYPLINNFAVFHSILLVSLLSVLVALILIFPKRKLLMTAFFVVLAIWGVAGIPEPREYNVDERKGWEWVPGYFPAGTYDYVSWRWHPLGRTDIFRIKDPVVGEQIRLAAPGTFEINVDPPPEFAYFSTNFLAGTPVYKLSPAGLAEKGSSVKLFTQAMEAPYVVTQKDPRVLVIGAGGGRDIFMAKTHGATEVLGAEINPAIFRAMAPGGKMYDYSGRVYTLAGTKVLNVDGRYLVKRIAPDSLDLIILNGVDTFSGLSSGAYAYAESYLYTKNAMMDYLRTLKPSGVVNFNRWLFYDMPRETLRLEAIAFDALKDLGVPEPWNHVLIGAHYGWSITLVKKAPFTEEEIKRVVDYFNAHDARLIYPSGKDRKITDNPLMFFDLYADAFQEGVQRAFEQLYPFDISVVTDDRPFFYKYYKFSSFNPFRAWMSHHTGTIIFLTQFLVLSQAFLFILIFIFLPLWLLRRRELKLFPRGAIAPFVVFFSCLGMGFMFVEIPLMQRFVLLLASPIYSITIVLAALLIATGVGSLFAPTLQKKMGSATNFLTAVTFAFAFYMLALVGLGTGIGDGLMGFPFFIRAAFVAGILFPLGFLLGVYFPTGLELVSRNYQGTIPWAWGVNCGFSVLGAILAIIIGQFWGFNAILLLAVVLYLTVLLAARAMIRLLASQAS